MSIREILKMGDRRLLRVAEPVREFGTAAMDALIADMFDTMHDADGAGLAAPQIGVNLQLVIFGFKQNTRYPDAPQVPETVLINPVLTPLSDEKESAFEGCLSVPGLRGSVPRFTRLRYQGVDQFGNAIDREVRGLSRARGAARGRPPARHPVPDAHRGFRQLRLHVGDVPRPRPQRRRLSFHDDQRICGRLGGAHGTGPVRTGPGAGGVHPGHARRRA